MKKVYVFGNEFIEGDSMAKDIASSLDAEIIHCRSPDDLLSAGDNITILDVVKNTDKVIIIDDISKIKTRNIVSLHDFDVGFFLKLMKEIGISKKVKIIGIPPRGNKEEIAAEVRKCI